MTRVAADRNRPDSLHDPVDADPGARGRLDARADSRVEAPDPTWLKLGIAAAIGLAAGATLFATEAQGRAAARDRRQT